MLTGKIALCAVGAVLCCAAPSLFCQQLSESLADNTALSSRKPQSENAARAAGVSQVVNASVVNAMDADRRADVKAEAGSVVEADYAGNGHQALGNHRSRGEFRIGGPLGAKPILGNPVEGRVELAPIRGLVSDHGEPARRAGKVAGDVGTPSSRKALRHGVRQTDRKAEEWALRGRESGSKGPGDAVATGVLYSKDFPDSTRGTALVNPAEAGTSSPLAWQPSLNFAFSDFTKRQFLNPSLHATHKARRSSQEAVGKKGPSTKNDLKYDLNLPSLSTSTSGGLRTHVPDPLDSLQDMDSQ